MIKFRSEAGRSTGTVKRKGSLAKMTNFGYYLDDDKAFIARCEEALAKAEVSEDLANKIAAAKEALEKEMEIEPVDMRSALNRLHSPLAKDDAEKEKIFKDSRSAVFLVRKAIYDTKLNGMVNTLTSKYASNAKRVLEDGIHTIEVTKGEMEKYGLTGDDVTAGLYSATTLSQSTKSKAVAEFIVKMRPQLEKAIDAVKAADAINASDLNAILLEMKDMFDEAQKDAEEIKYSVRTTIAAADKEDIDAIPQPDTLGESVQNEGVFSRLANWFSKVASRIRGFVDSILGLTDEANDEVDHLMGLLEGVEESVQPTRRFGKKAESDSSVIISKLENLRGTTDADKVTSVLSKLGFDIIEYGWLDSSQGPRGGEYSVWKNPNGMYVDLDYTLVKPNPSKDSWVAGDVISYEYYTDKADYEGHHGYSPRESKKSEASKESANSDYSFQLWSANHPEIEKGPTYFIYVDEPSSSSGWYDVSKEYADSYEEEMNRRNGNINRQYVAKKVMDMIVSGAIKSCQDPHDSIPNFSRWFKEYPFFISASQQDILGGKYAARSESKGIEQVRKELNDIADLWVGNDYGEDRERALADACTAVEGTDWEDAACAILKDSDMMERLTVAEAIELILSELPEA